MNWQHKAFVLRNLSRIPGGKSIYLQLQQTLGTTRPQPKRDFKRACELLELIENAGQLVTGTYCFEVGTGWHPFTPLAFFLAGADKIRTVDVNPWLSRKSAQAAIRSAEPHLEWFAKEARLLPEDVLERYQRIDTEAATLQQILQSMNTEYIYPGDATASGLNDKEVDFVVSSNVLEHVPYEILQEIYRESFRILKPGGLAVHRFNPGDHYANDDSRLTTANFLQFSSDEWNRYGSGLAYHNRLRCSQFVSLVEEAGFLAVVDDRRIDQNALQALIDKKLIPHSEFQQFELEDLASDYMWSVGMKPRAISESLPETNEIDSIAVKYLSQKFPQPK